MRTLLSPHGHRYLARAAIFLVLMAFIIGMVGCAGGEGEGEAPPYYELTINSTAGGSVATPGEGTFDYEPSESSFDEYEAERRKVDANSKPRPAS